MSHRHPRRARDERGASLSVFVATVIVALLAMAGLVVDGGAQAAAMRECQQVASEAARAGVDAGALARAAGSTPDRGAMLAAAQGVLATHSRLTGTVRLDGDAVVVTTSRPSQTVFLSLIGITTLPADGHATAVLKATGEQP